LWDYNAEINTGSDFGFQDISKKRYGTKLYTIQTID